MTLYEIARFVHIVGALGALDGEAGTNRTQLVRAVPKTRGGELSDEERILHGVLGV